MKLTKLRVVEMIQRAEDGGHPTPNLSNTFEHGEGVLVVSKRELLALFYDLVDGAPRRAKKMMRDVLLTDEFVARAGGSDAADLPDR